MPTLDPSELNLVIAVLGTFILAYGFISVKIKAVWYLGEARTSISRMRQLGVLTKLQYLP